MASSTISRSEVADSLDLSIVRYSRVWEDHAVLSRALQITSEDDVLSITSSGDNVLCLLLDEPKSIVAIDMSPAQNALLELKIAAIRKLDHKDFLCFLGETSGSPNDRVALYQEIRLLLAPPIKGYWDAHIEDVKQKLCLCGRLDKYFWSFHASQLSKLIPDAAIDALFEARTLKEQEEVFNKLPLAELEKALSQFSSKETQKSGRSSQQLKYVEDDDVSQHFWQRLKHVCQRVPIQDNFYLSHFLRGHRGYNPLEKPQFCSAYLRESEFHRLKGLIDRIHIHTGSVENYLTQSNTTFSKANLSDIFEYSSQKASDELFSLMANRCRSGGRLAFWNMLVPRTPSDKRLRLGDDCNTLHSVDRLMYYRAFYYCTVE